MKPLASVGAHTWMADNPAVVIMVNNSVVGTPAFNTTPLSNYSVTESDPVVIRYWGALTLSLLIVATALGNVLVCLAVAWEKRLQNMTNYFLMSLAIADLLVSILVMPLGMIVELYGYFPLDSRLCVLWACFDVLMCTASIWHMCTMSMDRYFTLKYPMKYGRNKTKTMVATKITFVWVVSIAICSPVGIMGFLDKTYVYNNSICVPTIREFIIYGSIFAFYVPLTIMVVTYILTIQILCNNQKLMNQIAKEHTIHAQVRKETNGNTSQFLKAIPRYGDGNSGETSVSFNLSVNESILPKSGSPSPCLTPMRDAATKICFEEKEEEHQSQYHFPENSPSRSECSLLQTVVNDVSGCQTVSLQTSQGMAAGGFSKSQPYLPSWGHMSSPVIQRHSKLPRATSHNNFQPHNYYKGKMYIAVSNPQSPSYLEARFPDNFMSAMSLNSMLSENCGSTMFSDFDEEMLEKLSQIEQEMDECLGIEIQPVDGNSQEPLVKASSLVELHHAPSGPAPTHTPVNSSGDSLDDDDSEETELITIQLQPSGCYMYKLNNSHSHSCLSPKPEKQDFSRLKPNTNSTNLVPGAGSSYTSLSPIVPRSCLRRHSTQEGSLDYTIDSEGPSNLSISTSGRSCRQYINHVQVTANNKKGKTAKWKSFLYRKKNKSTIQNSKYQSKNGENIVLRKHKSKNIISKRTASNEKKASKVLGIIFAVFVILWTPFFIVNILSAACQECLEQLTPTMMSSIVWLGYLSSLTNPIIYTMFNTAFRRAFYKILTCKFPRQVHSKTTDTFHMTSPTVWGSDNRRNTITLTMNNYN